MDPASGCCKPTINFSKTLFPVPLRPSTVSASPRATSRSMPSRTTCSPNALRSPLTRTAGPSVSVSLVARPSPLLVLFEEHDDQLGQDHVGQDDEERSDDHGGGGGPSRARGTARRAHPRKTSDEPDQQAEDHRLEGRREEI